MMSGGADGRRTSPCEGQDDEERAKRQHTEKTGLEMEVSNVAKIKDSRRILDLRCDVKELENIDGRDAAMFCSCELRPKGDPHAFAPGGSKLSQRGIFCRTQGIQKFNGPITTITQTSTGVMRRSSVKVCRAHQFQSSREP